jgi:hypothetical protein
MFLLHGVILFFFITGYKDSTEDVSSMFQIWLHVSHSLNSWHFNFLLLFFSLLSVFFFS